jgi:CBS domain-containing protein
MQAKELMSRNVECVFPDMFIQDVARIMKSMDVGFVPVCKDDRLIGTVTDRDIVLRAVAEDREIRNTRARDVMSDDVFWIYEDQPVEEVADFMATKEIRRVMILDRNKRLVGVISIGDLAKGGGQRIAGEAIRDIAEAPRAA